MTVVNATSIEQALSALAANPQARLIQGGTDLMVEVNFNRTKVENVVSLRN